MSFSGVFLAELSETLGKPPFFPMLPLAELSQPLAKHWILLLVGLG
ncbi:MAG: hypothetical protein EZS26_003562 [Candidatus Ordinivivax streblomastigis]|uniref:Uncharacterized protein n=1 Tax=Candidatus Ordinivivax streblomastigis TaxID=2540710 RepID=A0A5M8NTX6_9BACT|nr:MAG: hypothetical protein EZS26_003562 [Candidatus Ordinivivax streblomastigis]